ncbi:non-hydrolyzing UDP-N-acetylglucosamine 2-epimerase [Cumulibacter soli]|uniref:non-hydrolyzing UDP-N-acetylglucosamine 2-epimerase n=1 Tax=Cumulibacter soli TaxID=2546344 RepID=UPI0010683843|nr:UDP-N-acetylglucosamine 2-epimerase (non-hydrolyzing) [Cumulibacter soli]
MPRRIMVLFGTRPEAIKMAPIIAALRECQHLEPIVLTTGQHREMVDSVNAFFGVRPDRDLGLALPGQALNTFAARALQACGDAIRELQPDLVLVQGDTSSALMGALAAAHEQIPVGHIEAGLRTYDRAAPFPEEMNRVLIGQVSTLHFAATECARANLRREGIDERSIYLTGNTVIDALYSAGERVARHDRASSRIVLVTAHRRESWGAPLRQVGEAVARLADRYRDATFVVPAHLNPLVRESLLPPLLELPNVQVREPLDYPDLCQALFESHLVLTDSGGIQEEAPALGKPVLVLRETTERTEAIDAGVARLVGTDPDAIVAAASELFDSESAYRGMSNRAASPYGDGRAAARIVQAIGHHYGVGTSPDEFVVGTAARLGEMA